MWLNGSSLLVVTFLFRHLFCEPSTKEQLEVYNNYVKATAGLEKQDRVLMNTWTEEMLIKQVNITSSYRLQMTRHKEYCFRRRHNRKWQKCMDIYEKEINKPEKMYYENESECLKVANSADADKNLAISQIEKEIRKWRKGYRYLSNLCHTNHPDDEEESGDCLVEFMQRDNYNMAVQRLMVLKLEAMSDFCNAINEATSNLENCIKTDFSRYIENIRSVMEILNRCYKLKNNKP